MDVRLLGPVELEVGGIGFGVGGPRAQAVLALLVVRAGEVVTADWLIDQLWGEHPPRAARVALQSYVSRLRGLAVPDTERLLPRHRSGYFLDTSVTGVDAQQFIRLSEQGRDLAAGGRWREALESLRSARALWHGVPFTGIDEVPALTAERARLEEMGVETRFSELEAALEIVGPSDVVGSLRELVNTYPWNERGWRLLMLALYRAGRQTEALRAAARARHLLTEEQGLEPSRDLAELEHQILTHHRALKPSAPAPITLRGRLTTTSERLIGRERELAELLAEWETSSRCRQARLVLVEGEPGVGKSHLVAELARNVEARGGTVLAGRCLDEPRLPLQPWSDLIPDISSDSAARAPVAEWKVCAHRLFSAITGQFLEVLRSGVTLLVTEDLHWADVAALRLLDRLLTCCADLPLLVVATVRSTASGMLPPARGALGELSTRVQPHTIHLRGLGPPDLCAMLAGRGLSVSAAEANSIWLRTGGVPLLAVEALRGGDRVLDARFARVSDTAVTTADLLAMAGDPAPLALLHAASGLDDETLAAALEELIAAGVVRAAHGTVIAFEFCHPLYREVIEGQLSDLRRLLLSRRLLAAADVVPDVVLPSIAARHSLALVACPTGLILGFSDSA